MTEPDWAEIVACEIMATRLCMWLDAEEKAALGERIALALRGTRYQALKDAAEMAEDIGDAAETTVDDPSDSVAAQQVSAEIARSIRSLRHRLPDEGSPIGEVVALHRSREARQRGVVEVVAHRHDGPGRDGIGFGMRLRRAR